MTAPAINRRAFLRGATLPDRLPPWVSAKALSHCTSCAECVAACPEEIISISRSGYPSVDFSHTGCTFCGACADACPEDVFGSTQDPAWDAEVRVSDDCLLKSGVSCQLCTDFCDAEALQFDLSIRPSGGLVIQLQDCTGCGMCVGACPTNAISVQPIQSRVAA